MCLSVLLGLAVLLVFRLLRALMKLERECAELSQSINFWRNNALALEAKTQWQPQRQPTLRFSRLDGEPGKVFDTLRADGSGYIVSRN